MKINYKPSKSTILFYKSDDFVTIVKKVVAFLSIENREGKHAHEKTI